MYFFILLNKNYFEFKKNLLWLLDPIEIDERYDAHWG